MRVSRQEGDAGGGNTHQEERSRQLGFAPEVFLNLHECNGPDGPCKKGKSEYGEGIQRAFEFLLKRKEYCRKYQHRGNGIDEKVKVLRGSSDDHADCDFAGCD